MREHTCTLAGEELTLVANFKASLEIAEKIGDPLMIAREASVEAYMLADYVPYQPRFSFNVNNVPQLLHIGLKAGGSTMTLSRVQELVFEEGFAAGRREAENYLALIVGPQSANIEDFVKSDGAEDADEGNVDGSAS